MVRAEIQGTRLDRCWTAAKQTTVNTKQYKQILRAQAKKKEAKEANIQHYENKSVKQGLIDIFHLHFSPKYVCDINDTL